MEKVGPAPMISKKQLPLFGEVWGMTESDQQDNTGYSANTVITVYLCMLFGNINFRI